MASRTKMIAGGAVVAVVVLAVALVAWFLRDDAPDEVSLDAAVDAADGGGSGDDGSGTGGSVAVDPDAELDGDIGGTWTIDTDSGEFDYESATGTFVGFRIDEELSSIGSTTAVGRTGDVDGSITIDGSTLTDASLEVDLTTITTNESRRDSRVQSALETDQFPTATFTLTEPVDLGEGAADGEEISVDAPGDLTIHGETQSVVLPLQAQLVGDTVVVVTSLDLIFADYGVEVPTAPVVVSAEDHGPLEAQLLFVKS